MELSLSGVSNKPVEEVLLLYEDKHPLVSLCLPHVDCLMGFNWE
jgi:hypothetical protein